jgi:hypothetical protein
VLTDPLLAFTVVVVAVPLVEPAVALEELPALATVVGVTEPEDADVVTVVA